MRRDSPPPNRPKPFHPVPLRSRRDGWTAERQAEFIGRLAMTRSVSAAALGVGMGRESAYRLRAKPGAESFARAWDAARATPKRKSTIDLLAHRAFAGRIAPLLYRGRYLGTQRSPDDSALLELLRRRFDGRLGSRR